MAWTDITNALVAVGAKPFASTIQALRDNIPAIAAGLSGAPEVEVAWHFLDSYESSADESVQIDFSGLDVSGYRALRIVGGYNGSLNIGDGGADELEIQMEISASWTTMFTLTNDESNLIMFEVENTDGDDGLLTHKFGRMDHFTTIGSDWTNAGASGVRTAKVLTGSTAATGIRINTGGSGDLMGGTGETTRFALYGIKRTQP